jgi:hypothetical protein
MTQFEKKKNSIGVVVTEEDPSGSEAVRLKYSSLNIKKMEVNTFSK